MSLEIRRLKLIVNTLHGDYGADLRFPSGLALLHKDNTRGKSTALKAIIYALGLERMFGPVDQPPLPPAMTTTLRDGADEWPVVESWVLVEIVNRDGRVATLRRKVAGEGGQDRKLINVWERSVLDQPQLEEAPKAFYARDPGSAVREQGIYTFLADFLGWKLPEVLRFDGTQTPLYIECLLSLFFVEQSQGWTTIQAVTPRFMQIRQVEKKAIEFLLNLDACATDTLRQQIELEETELRREWTAARSQLEGLAQSIGGALRELPKEPQASWPPTTAPFIEAFLGGEAIPLSVSVQRDRETLQQLEEEEIPSAEQAAAELRGQLEEAYRQLYAADGLATETRENLVLERANLLAIETRLEATSEDLDHHKGEKKVRDLGFAKGITVASQECPTCHQSLEDSLLDQREPQQVMTLDENIAYLEAQLQTLGKMRARTAGAADALERRLAAIENYANEMRGNIRSLKRTLTSSGSAPSEAAVRQRLLVEERLQQRIHTLESFHSRFATFASFADRWRDLQARKRNLREETTSASDQQKLSRLERLFLDALADFGFDSFPVETITLDRQSYKPTRQGFDVSYDVSASDNIRVIAAYLTALFELAREFPTNHPGLLILDEPRQQNMKWGDFARILKRLAAAKGHGQQVIVATSDQPERVRALEAEVAFTKLDLPFDPPLLQPLGPAQG